jgi:hypothetical protein
MMPRGGPLRMVRRSRETGMPVDPLELGARKSGTLTGLARLLPWVAQIAATFRKRAEYFFPPSHTAIARESGARVEVAGQAGARTEAVQIAEESITSKTLTETLNPEMNLHSAIRTDRVVDLVLDQQEIERRRNLVRTLFNDFWRGFDDKPVAFLDRLDQAETYLNERLAASGEAWHLDAETRILLGLPSRSKSSDQIKIAYRHKLWLKGNAHN